MRGSSRQSAKAGDGALIVQATGDVTLELLGENFPIELVNDHIEKSLDRLIKSRFYPGFDRQLHAQGLAEKILGGNLQGGSGRLKSKALAWSARILISSDPTESVREIITQAKKLDDNVEVTAAEALLLWKEKGLTSALTLLSGQENATARTISYFMVANEEGLERAQEWLAAVEFDGKAFDPDGKFIHLSHLLQLECWEKAIDFVQSAVVSTDVDVCPALGSLVAVSNLLSVVHPEFRPHVVRGVPFHASECRFKDSVDALEVRRLACRQFKQAALVARSHGQRQSEEINNEYALWLELSDSETRENGKQIIQSMLRSPETSLGIVYLALQYGVELDTKRVEEDIQNSRILYRETTRKAAFARYALAFSQPGPAEAASYIELHFDELSPHVDPAAIRFDQIQLYCKAGRRDKAEEILGDLGQEKISEDLRSRMKAVISAATDGHRIEILKRKFVESESIYDLIALVEELDSASDISDLLNYSLLLYEETKSLLDLERYVSALERNDNYAEIARLLYENPPELELSKKLHVATVSALYNEGKLNESKAVLDSRPEYSDETMLRIFRVNLAIAMGDIDEIQDFVYQELKQADSANPVALLNTAHLAYMVGSRHAEALLFAAAKQGMQDPGVLAGAYHLATSSGLESEPEVFEWLESAASLSGDEGPVQRVDIDFLIDWRSEWDSHERGVWQLLTNGEVTNFLAARSLNKSLVDLTLLPALANLQTTDPRRRSGVAAYSGVRDSKSANFHKKTVAFDLTALLTLGFLEVLEEICQSVEKIYIAHSTLGWLLKESYESRHHQPSRIKDAIQVRSLVASSKIQKLELSSPIDPDLAQLIGDDLAGLISEAEVSDVDESTHRFVVQPAPVHVVSSRMKEHANLDSHCAVLVSCETVIDFLHDRGVLLSSEEERCRSYLRLQEKRWQNEPKITENATLYLDYLAVTYFQHLGLLGKLTEAGLDLVVSPTVIEDAEALSRYETISAKVVAVLDKVREVLREQILEGRVEFSTKHRRSSGNEIEAHPTMEIIAHPDRYDDLLVDDRFLNQHPFVGNEQSATTWTTIDVLEFLKASSKIDHTTYGEYRSQLRRAGYYFVPIDEEELLAFLLQSSVGENHVIEIAELKAIRESILRIKMSDWLQLPKEQSWLGGCLKALVAALKSLWKLDLDIEETIVRSQWIFELLDMRQWAQTVSPDDPNAYIEYSRGPIVNLLLLYRIELEGDRQQAYSKLIEDHFLLPIEMFNPNLFAQIIEWHKAELVKISKLELGEDYVRE